MKRIFTWFCDCFWFVIFGLVCWVALCASACKGAEPPVKIVVDDRVQVVTVNTGGFYGTIVYFLPTNKVFQARAVLVLDLTRPSTTLVEKK